MNDSLDLRKRILKMRENNNFVFDKMKSEEIQKEVKIEEIQEEVKIEEIQEEVKSKPITEELIKDNNYKAIEKRPVFFDNNEAQFRIIANKFNEAVEVILELSDKVKKLEQEIYNNDIKIQKNKRFFYQINFKIIILLILIPLFIIGIFTLPFDLSIISLIFNDIVSSI